MCIYNAKTIQTSKCSQLYHLTLMQMEKSVIVCPHSTGLVATFSSYGHFEQFDHYLAGKSLILNQSCLHKE